MNLKILRLDQIGGIMISYATRTFCFYFQHMQGEHVGYSSYSIRCRLFLKSQTDFIHVG